MTTKVEELREEITELHDRLSILRSVIRGMEADRNQLIRERDEAVRKLAGEKHEAT